MERKEAIRSAYRLTGGNNFYDGMITCSTSVSYTHLTLPTILLV